MRRLTINLVLLVLILGIAVAICAKQAPAESAADFYKKNMVNLIVPHSPGGGTDFNARLFAAFWPKVTGGKMVVRNMPGGGTLVGTNYLYKAKPDGLTMGCIGKENMLAAVLLKRPGVQFEIEKFTTIGWYSNGFWVFGISPKSPIKSMVELQKMKGLKLGSPTGKMGGHSLAEAMLIELFGLEGATVVSGYKSFAEVSLAVAKGELDGACTSGGTFKAELDKGFLKGPLVICTLEGRDKIFPDVPAIPELMTLNSEQKSLMGVVEAIANPIKGYFAPPGLPKDRTKFLRDSFSKIINLESFQKGIKKRYLVWYWDADGEEMHAQLKKMLAVNKKDIDRLLQLIDKYVR
jgi:tripartite-type tricarboxylate transporter receptor subunit TctC